MNNPDNLPIDVEEQRAWLRGYKDEKGLSWAGVAEIVGIPPGTISNFAGGTYNSTSGNEKLGRAIYRYRQLIDSQAERSIGLVDDPGYFETATSRRLRGLLTIAHMGRITVGATGPGTGKTVTMREYAASISHVWIATMRQSTRTTNAMTLAVLRAIGVPVKGGGSGHQLSQLVVESVRGKRGLLVIDEANHLTWEALEEIRSWHDEEGVQLGVCLLGNEELLMTIQSGARRDRYGRLNSRIASSHIQNCPVPEDVEAFCNAWSVLDPGMRQHLSRIALTPGAGGLRECRQIVEQASMLAADEGRPLSLGDLRDAQSTRATRHVRS